MSGAARWDAMRLPHAVPSGADNLLWLVTCRGGRHPDAAHAQQARAG